MKFPSIIPSTLISLESALVALIDVCCNSDLATPASFSAAYASIEIRMSGKLFPVSINACNDLIPEPFDLIFVFMQLLLLLSLDDVLLIEYDTVGATSSVECADIVDATGMMLTLSSGGGCDDDGEVVVGLSFEFDDLNDVCGALPT